MNLVSGTNDILMTKNDFCMLPRMESIFTVFQRVSSSKLETLHKTLKSLIIETSNCTSLTPVTLLGMHIYTRDISRYLVNLFKI